VIADAHNDLLTELAFRAGEERPFAAHWRTPLRHGGVALQVCAVFPDRDRLARGGALHDALAQISACHRAVRESAGDVVLVREREDLDGLAPERPGLLLALEGAEPLGADARLLEAFWALGVRMVALTWNDRNVFAGGSGESDGPGLSPQGRSLVHAIADRGFAIDLAHASERTFQDVLDAAPDAQVLVSHAGCRGVFDVPRNLSDAQLRALAGRGGVLGIMSHPAAVDVGEPTLARLVDHVDHAVATMGAEHVALGADFIGQVLRSGAIGGTVELPGGAALSAAIPGFDGPADYPRLVEALARRGYSGAALHGILFGNLAALMARVLPSATSGSQLT